jgi:hypothetical protein
MHEGHLSPFALMRLLAGEVAGEERARMATHLDACRDCAGVLAGLEAEQRQGARETPLLVLPRRRRWWPARFGVGFGVGLVAAAAAVVAVAVLPREVGIRPKGGAHVEFACKDGPRIWTCLSGERVRAGAAVAVRVRLDGPRWLMLMGRDGTGRWRTYLPASGKEAVRFQADVSDPLGSSLVLDETPGEERFVLVAAQRAFRRGDLLPAGDGAPELRVPMGFEVAELRLIK